MGSGISLGQVIFLVASVIFLISLAVIVFAVVKKIMKKPISKSLKIMTVSAILALVVCVGAIVAIDLALEGFVFPLD